MSRCRICTSNDRDQLVEDMARAMWDTQESSSMDAEWEPWDKAPPYWQNIMRQFADVSLKVLQHQFTG